MLYKINSINLNRDHVLAELLTEYMSKSGSWNVCSFTSFIELNLILAKHTDCTVMHWAERLYQKILTLL